MPVHGKHGIPIEPIDLRVVGMNTFAVRQVMDAPAAEAPASVSQVDDPCLELDRLRKLDYARAQCRSCRPHKPTGTALRDLKSLEHPAHRFSGCASASSFLSFAFSAASSRNRFASLTFHQTGRVTGCIAKSVLATQVLRPYAGLGPFKKPRTCCSAKRFF
jgi:hypothetical protein